MTAKKAEPSKGGKESKPVGRPRKFSSPDEFDALVDSYILECQDPDKPRAITLTGMVLALGFCSKDTFYEYQKYPEFTDSVKRARLLVEQEYENRLITSTSAAGSIFALKNFGWMDKHPTELDVLQTEKLRREMAQGDDDPEARPESVTVTVEDASKRDGK